MTKTIARRIIQIAFGPGGVLYAVADDGTLWQKNDTPAWLLVDPLPPRRRATNVKGTTE